MKIIIFVFIIFWNLFQFYAQTLDGTYNCGTSFEGYKYIFTKEGTFETTVSTDYGRSYYGRGFYEIRNDSLFLNFENIPDDEFDTLFVHKEISVDTNNQMNPIEYKFNIQKYYPASLYGAVVCLYSINGNIIKPNKESNDTCVFADSLGFWNLSIDNENLPAIIKVYFHDYRLLTFKVIDKFSRYININLKNDWYYYFPYTSHYKVSSEKHALKNLESTSFYMQKGSNWYRFVRKD